MKNLSYAVLKDIISVYHHFARNQLALKVTETEISPNTSILDKIRQLVTLYGKD